MLLINDGASSVSGTLRPRKDVTSLVVKVSVRAAGQAMTATAWWVHATVAAAAAVLAAVTAVTAGWPPTAAAWMISPRCHLGLLTHQGCPSESARGLAPSSIKVKTLPTMNLATL